MKRRISKRWLINGIITTILFGIVMIPVIRDEIKVKTEAATNVPVLAGPSVGWSNSATSNYLFTKEGASSNPEVYKLTFTASDPDVSPSTYQLVKKGTDPWQRFPSSEYDKANSNAKDFVITFPGGDENFTIAYPGEVTIRMYNPDNITAYGPRRYTVNYTNLQPSGKSSIVVVGGAVGHTSGWNKDDPNTRMSPLSGFDGRYAELSRWLDASQFKAFVYKTWVGDWGYSAVDLSNSTASGAIEYAQGTDNNIRVKTAANYKLLFDFKTRKLLFQNNNTEIKLVTKFEGATVIEKEATFDNLVYTPTSVEQPGKRFDGWFTDAALTKPYTPRAITGTGLALYAKYTPKTDTKLVFYDKNQLVTTEEVSVFGWNNTGGEPLGGYPGTQMTKHGYGYHTLDIEAVQVSDNLVFNNGFYGGVEVKTHDIVWNWESGENRFNCLNLTEQTMNSWQIYTAAQSDATLFGIRILHETLNCDPTGAANNVTTQKWGELATEYAALDVAVKSVLQGATADVNGDVLAQAMARYDYFVGKYGGADYANFINRSQTPSGVRKPVDTNTDSLMVALVIGGFSLSAIAGVGMLRRRKYN